MILQEKFEEMQFKWCAVYLKGQNCDAAPAVPRIRSAHLWRKNGWPCRLESVKLILATKNIGVEGFGKSMHVCENMNQ